MPEYFDPKEVFKGAKWIWPQTTTFDLVNYLCEARLEFALAAAPRKCVVKVTADSRYKLFVNGRYANFGPARGFQAHWPFDEIDIAPLLRRGRNVIAAEVHSFGISTFEYISKDAGGFILSGRAGKADISTGRAWKVRSAPGYVRHMTRSSIQTGFQEIYDARREDESWKSPGYDESGWWKPSTTEPGAMPWHSVEERGIPQLLAEIETPIDVAGEADGRSGDLWREATHISRLYFHEKRAWRPSGVKLARRAGAAAFRAAAAGKGRFRSYMLDFGRETIGSIILEVKGAAGGEIIDSQVVEVTKDGAPVMGDPVGSCDIAFGNRLILRKGAARREQFAHWGFRYLILTVRDSARPLDISVSLRGARYPLDVRAEFESADDRLDGIHRISVRAQECCMIDAYVDCPWREQAQWWGDARVQAANTIHLSGDTRVLARGVRQIGAQAAPNGLTYGLGPSHAHMCILPDYTLTWVETLWDHYWHTGSTDLIAEEAGRVRYALSYFEEMAAETGLLPYDDRYWLFLDWADIFKEGYPTVYNIMYFDALNAASRLFKLIGRREDSAKYAGMAEAQCVRIVKRLYDARRDVFHGGLDWKGRAVKQGTAHAYAMAVVSGLMPEKRDLFIQRELLPLTLGGTDAGGPETCGTDSQISRALIPSPFFMYYVLEALKQSGYKAEAVDCIRRWWGLFLDRGLSTTPENWHELTGWGSACHAWSAHPIVHLHNVVLGVTQASAGWNAISFEPVFCAGRFARGVTATPKGDVESAWQMEGTAAHVHLALPKGMSAKVSLPGVHKTVVGGRHEWRVEF